MGVMPIEGQFWGARFCANPARVQRTEDNFAVRIPQATNNVAKNSRKEGKLTAK
jgi:hypothetical protein